MIALQGLEAIYHDFKAWKIRNWKSVSEPATLSLWHESAQTTKPSNTGTFKVQAREVTLQLVQRRASHTNSSFVHRYSIPTFNHHQLVAGKNGNHYCANLLVIFRWHREFSVWCDHWLLIFQFHKSCENAEKHWQVRAADGAAKDARCIWNVYNGPIFTFPAVCHSTSWRFGHFQENNITSPLRQTRTLCGNCTRCSVGQWGIRPHWGPGVFSSEKKNAHKRHSAWDMGLAAEQTTAGRLGENRA